MSTEFFNDQWRIPSNENQNKVSNYSMDFDSASSDYIDAGTGLGDSLGTYTGDASISLWFKADTTTSNEGLFTMTPFNGSDFGDLRINISSNILYFVSSALTSYKYISFTDTASWHHLVCIFKSGDITNSKIYLDGVDKTTTDVGTFPSSLSLTGLKTIIGAYRGTSNTFNGKINQVTFFDYALSASQVSTLYGGGTAVTNPMTISFKPIAYYQLGDQSVDNGANYLVPNNSFSDFVFNFDGNDDYIDCGDSDDFSFGNGSTDSPFSISAWVNMDDATTFRIVSKAGTNGNEYFLTNGGDDKLNFILYDTFGSGNIRAKYDTALTSYEGQWIHVVGTYSGVNRQNGIELYLNGSLLTTVKVLNSPYTAMGNTTQPLEIARAASSSYANGKFSNLALFNSALTSSQVQTLYNNGSPNDISSLSPLAWYKLNAADTFDGTNWTINDYGSGDNDGTSDGMDSSNLVVSDLQQTSGFSPYALNFDGTQNYLNGGNINSFEREDAFSGSCWVNLTGSDNEFILSKQDSTAKGYMLYVNTSRYLIFFITSNSTINKIQIRTNSTVVNNTWNHLAFTWSGSGASSGVNLYINGVNQSLTNIGDTFFTGSIVDATIPFQISGRDGSGANGINGSVSNVSTFDYELTSTQVIEIYNEGVPSDLNNFSGTAPVNWWQLGSNSSFDSNTWTCLDEIGSNNLVSSANMTNDDITDGVGYSASGLGTSSIDISNDAPYSTGNGLSEGMDVLDRSTDVAPS